MRILLERNKMNAWELIIVNYVAAGDVIGITNEGAGFRV